MARLWNSKNKDRTTSDYHGHPVHLLPIFLQDVNKLWEKAVQELDRDEQLVKFMVEKEQKQENKIGRQRAFSANSYYDSVAIPEARDDIHHGCQTVSYVLFTLNDEISPCKTFWGDF